MDRDASNRVMERWKQLVCICDAAHSLDTGWARRLADSWALRMPPSEIRVRSNSVRIRVRVAQQRCGAFGSARAYPDSPRLPQGSTSRRAIFAPELDASIIYWNPNAAQLLWLAGGGGAQGQRSHDLLRTQFSDLPLPLDELLVRDGVWEGQLVHQTRKDGP